MIVFALYLLKVTICSGILFGYYWLALRNKIFHQYNRFYLLAIVLLSIVLPLIQIDIWQNANQPTSQGIKLLQVVNSSQYLDKFFNESNQPNFTAEQVYLFFYVITSVVFAVLFIHALTRIYSLFKKHQHRFIENIYFINTTAPGTPFTFLRCIFWNDHIDPESVTGNYVFRHELAHVRQKHSYDKLLMNLVQVFFWCNPFFWLVRKELNMIHEFIADKIAVDDSDTGAFAAMILQATYPQHQFALTNPFFYSPIKRRLIMLVKNKNSKVGYIGRLFVLPLAVAVFAAFTLKAKTFQQGINLYDGKTFTVVVDAGHGGTDAGAIGALGKTMEKDLNLAIVKKIKLLNTNPRINILLTRETDITQTPLEKVAFAKTMNADLFISIHLSAGVASDGDANRGVNIWVPSNLSPNTNGSNLIASALINEFNNNYMLPVAQHPQQYKSTIRVLKDADCPAVLIEAGNISNAKDIAFLQTDAAQNTIAAKVIAAIQKYAIENEKAVAGNYGKITPTIAIDTVPSFGDNKEQPLIIVDGKTIKKSELDKINPDVIASVNVIKNKESIAKYGDKGKYGVVIITTKKKEIVASKTANGTKKVAAINLQQENKISTLLSATNKADALKQPLYIIDGKLQDNGYDLKSLSPVDIESLNIIKDETAINKYGEKAKNGVIEITTKNKVHINVIPATDVPQ
ncbi:MAG: N-acetylmuramoyl-L-alanine amidase [Ferruginibacter sp.]